MPRIGLFGGTFDPPHLGHSILAAEALACPEAGQSFLDINSAVTVKRRSKDFTIETTTGTGDCGVTKMPGFELSLVDVNREPPYYAIDTVRILKTKIPVLN